MDKKNNDKVSYCQEIGVLPEFLVDWICDMDEPTKTFGRDYTRHIAEKVVEDVAQDIYETSGGVCHFRDYDVRIAFGGVLCRKLGIEVGCPHLSRRSVAGLSQNCSNEEPYCSLLGCDPQFFASFLCGENEPSRTVATDYIAYHYIRHIAEMFVEDVAKDVYETSGGEAFFPFAGIDVRLSFGRVLCRKLGIDDVCQSPRKRSVHLTGLLQRLPPRTKARFGIKRRSNMRKLFKEMSGGERLDFLHEVLNRQHVAWQRLEDKFKVIMARLEDGEYYNIRDMKEQKRRFDELLASFSTYSTLFKEWSKLDSAEHDRESRKYAAKLRKMQRKEEMEG